MQVITESDTSPGFALTENQKMIAEMVRNFGAKEIRPKMMEWDESQEFPVEVFKKMGSLGLMGVLVPEIYGGAGLGYEPSQRSRTASDRCAGVPAGNRSGKFVHSD